jgi:hypothetical protein
MVQEKRQGRGPQIFQSHAPQAVPHGVLTAVTWKLTIYVLARADCEDTCLASRSLAALTIDGLMDGVLGLLYTIAPSISPWALSNAALKIPVPSRETPVHRFVDRHVCPLSISFLMLVVSLIPYVPVYEQTVI